MRKEMTMVYLIFAILCSASINLGFALVKEKKLHNLVATWFNYMTAALVSLVLLLRSSLPSAALSFSAMADNIGGRQTDNGSLTFAVVVGIATGVVYIGSLLAIQYSILRSGPSPTTMFNKLGAMLPVLASMALFSEHPTPLCWVGIAVAMTALIVYNAGGSFRFDWLLLAAFFLGGTAELSNKLFTAWCGQQYKPLFLLCIFGTAFVLCTVLLFAKGRPAVRLPDAAVGVAIGAVNLGSSFLVMRALTELPAGVVFPALCAGVVLLIALVSRMFFRERLGTRGWTAVGLTAVSLVLLNL